MEGGNYVRIKEETEDTLVLIREPSSRAWAILIGLVSLGVGAAWYINDYLLWKLAYISGMLFVGVSCFEDWEECEFNKTEERVKISKTSLFQKLIPTKDKKIVTGDLCDITQVCVEEEPVRYGGKAYLVVLKFAGGYSLSVTETATIGDKTAHDAIAEKIRRFLQLGDMPLSPDDVDNDLEEMKPALVDDSEKIKKAPLAASVVASDVSVGEATETPAQASGSSSSDEGFEKIETSDVPAKDKPNAAGDDSE